jgi:uncharacterized protein (TIGR03000 family)
MYSMVLMAALTTGVDMPDRGGCRGGRGGCWGGCYGGMGMGMGMGCYGGMGMGMGCWGGGYGMGYGMGWGGRGYGYGGYTLGGYSPMIGGYAYSPVISSWGTPVASTVLNPGSQSFYYNPNNSNSANEATLLVHLPESASLSIDGQPTRQSSGTRVFHSPPLEQGKTYTYTITAEMNRDGHVIRDTKSIDVRAGQRSEVTMNFAKNDRREDRERER